MANSRFNLLPGDAEYPSTNFPEYKMIHSTLRRPVLAYDASTSETAYWTRIVPQGWSGAVVAVITYCMASATSGGGVAFDVAFEAVTSGDSLDLDASSSFDTVNGGSDSAVPSTAGYMEQITITCSNLDSAAAGDYLRVSVARDVADSADNASGDCYVLAVEIRDAV